MQLLRRVATLALVVTACNTPAPTAGPSGLPGEAPSDSLVASPAPADSGEPAGPAETPPEAGSPSGPTSADLLRDAYLSGAIDVDTWLTHMMNSAFAPHRLPAEFKGDDSTILPPDGGPTAIAAQERVAEMSPELRGQIEPYFQRPDDPSSFWSGGLSDHVARAPLAQIGTPAQEEDENGLVWNYVDAASTQIRVWYWTLGPSVVDDGSDPAWTTELATLRELSASGPALAARVAAEYDASGMWTKEKDAMLGHEPCSDSELVSDGGDGRLDVYMVTTGIWTMRKESGSTIEADAVEGVTIPLANGDGCYKIPFILLRQTLDWDRLRSAMAHELFHAFEFSFTPVRRSRTLADGKVVHPDFQFRFDYEWWYESNAAWAEDLVYPGVNVEHRQIWCWARKDPAPNGPLDDGWCRYASYQFPFYLTRLAGRDPSFIGELWATSQDLIPIQVVGAMPDWEDRFKEFNLWNWNADPVEKYFDPGDRVGNSGKIERIRQRALPVTVDLINGAATIDAELPRTTGRYYEVTFDDTPGEIRRVKFDLADLASKDHAGIQAIVTVSEGPGAERRYTEDWSAADEKTFCRDIPTEHVTSVVLVVTNDSVTDNDTITGKIQVEATAEVCAEGSGTVTIGQTKSGTYTSARNNPVNVSLNSTATITFDLVSDEFGSITAESSTITWTYHMESVETGEECVITERGDGGGTWSGEGGPGLLLGWSAPDGTLFGMQIDESKYALTVAPPSPTMPDEDPSGWYQFGASICGEFFEYSGWMPFTALAVVDGDLPEDLTSTYSGSRTRTLPALNSFDVPTTEVVTWSFTLQPEDIPPD